MSQTPPDAAPVATAEEPPERSRQEQRRVDYWKRQVATQRAVELLRLDELRAAQRATRELMLAAQESGGLTYEELMDAAGLSRARVGSALKQARDEKAGQGTPDGGSAED